MEKINQTNTTTGIYISKKKAGDFTLTTFDNGTMTASFKIDDPTIFHSTSEAAQDLANLVSLSVNQSKALLADFEASEN
ncbi:hypothetical protein SM120_00365 [Lactococcus lactis subsp. lactis]|uniref:hypothetical protein n=1 Tax=Lactococcus lactis TaxID=1358 RepID=UPI002A7F786B|nr:hypothetical protein [Lactococcus lactis]MDY4362095.1 hypothetical protein [Lactococcus lactis subsp. lactis]